MKIPPEDADERFEIELELRQRVKITGALKDLHIMTGVPVDRLAQVLRGEDSLTVEEDETMWDYLYEDTYPEPGRVTVLSDDSQYELRRPR